MSGLLHPPTGAGGGEEDRILRPVSRKNGVPSPPEASNITDRKFVFGTPTSQLSSNTEQSSQNGTVDNKPSLSDVGMSPVRDSIGKLVPPRKDGARFSEDNSSSSPSRVIPLEEQAASPQGEEEKKERRWDSARARLGSVLSSRHGIRESMSKVRRKSVDPSHLMNDLNSRESGSRADPKTFSAHGSGQQSPHPPNVTAATSMTDSTGHTGQFLNVPGSSSPSRFSSRFSSWKNNLGTHKGRGRGSPQGQEGIADSTAAEQLRSSSTPPPQKFKVRVNRFLRSGRRSVSPKTESPNSESTAPEHLEFQASDSNIQTPPYLSSAESSTVRGTPKSGLGFRKALRRGVSSARRKMSVPFLSTPPPSDHNPEVPRTGPPQRPQTAPLEKRDRVLGVSGESRFMLGGEAGPAFLPSEATNVIPFTAPPVVTENPRAGDWTMGDFENIHMIQSHPPLSPPGLEESPPLSPWVKAPGEPQPWLELTPTSPRLPEITSVAPFAVDELMTPDFASAKAPSGGQKLSDMYWAVASGSGADGDEGTQARDKGKGRAKSTASDLLKLPESFYPDASSGKSIEVLEEEKRRKSRDTGIMGLGPEVASNSEPLTTSSSREKDDDGEFTYAAAVREIAGLGRFPKRPPPDASTDDVSAPLPECDYDLPLPNFRFSILPEPSSSSNEPGASPCAASSSLTQETSGSASNFATLAPTHTQNSTTTTQTTTTTHTTTAASTNLSTAITSPSDYTPYNYQMLLSSKRPYLFVLQELSSGTYIKITPQKNSSPVSRSPSTVTASYPETPAPSQTSPGDARSPVSMRFTNGFGLLAGDAEANEETDEDNEDNEDNEDEEKGKGKGRERKKR